MVESDLDVLIVGGGAIGCAMLCALMPLNLKINLIDDKPITIHSSFDTRSIALSNSSIQILKSLQVWSHLENQHTAIKNIHISEKGILGHARLMSQDQPLGAVVEMTALNQAFHAVFPKDNYIAPGKLLSYDKTCQVAIIKTPQGERKVKPKIIIAADGADSVLRSYCQLPVKVKPYDQQAIVANIGLARSHDYWAFERFTKNGPLALLPLSEQRAALIWVNSPERTHRLNQLAEVDFLKELQTTFGYRLGRFLKVGKRTAYPLSLKIMPEKVCGSVVFIGNAAHTLHPIAGQGFNLGLRDVAMLAQCLYQEGLSPQTLLKYQQLRLSDESVITHFTDGLIQLFAQQFPGLSFARGLGLITLDNVKLFQKIVSRYAGGYAGVISDLACGINFSSEQNISLRHTE